MRYLVAYDIPDDKRRTRVYNQLRNFGQRLQFSMFACDLEAADYLRMRRKVEVLLDCDEDRLHIFPLCATCVNRTIAMGPSLISEDSFAVWVL